MTSQARRVLEAALALPAEDRRQVGEALLESAPLELNDETRLAWRDEVLRRIEEVRRGEIEPEPWSEVKRHIRGALAR